MNTSEKSRASVRRRADKIRPHRCKNLIAVIESPRDIRNIGTVIRNVNGFGVEKAYIVDPTRKLPDSWQEMRERSSLLGTSVSAIKWSFVRRFDSTGECLGHLAKKGFVSIVTSPYAKGKRTVVLHEADFTQPKVAVWFGSEGRGISEEAAMASEFCVTIPMFGMIESLNLGTTSGIVLYEVTKQRRAYQEKKRRTGRAVR